MLSGRPEVGRLLAKDNETVKVLYQPGNHEPPECDIVFFHGLQLGGYETAWDHTWRNQDGVLWPRDWLADDFPQSRVMSVSCDSQARNSTLDMDEIGERLVANLCGLVRYVSDGFNCRHDAPIGFSAHA